MDYGGTVEPFYRIEVKHAPGLPSMHLAGFGAIGSFVFDECPSLSILTGFDLANCGDFRATGCALSQATVDAIILAGAASGQAIQIDLTGGAPSAPSATIAITNAISVIISNGGSVTHN